MKQADTEASLGSSLRFGMTVRGVGVLLKEEQIYKNQVSSVPSLVI